MKDYKCDTDGPVDFFAVRYWKNVRAQGDLRWNGEGLRPKVPGFRPGLCNSWVISKSGGCGSLHQSPDGGDIVPCGSDVSDRQPNHEASVKDRMREEHFAGCIYGVHQATIVIVRSAVSKAHHR